MEDRARKVNYLRMSITDRCNLRCVYCTYWRDWTKLRAAEILSYEELLRLAAVAVEVGIRKIRVTGGEPLVRRGIVDFVRDLCCVPGLEKVCLTTNGVLLRDLGPALYEAGLRHLNVSLDTLSRERYRAITGRDDLLEVLSGLNRAVSLGFQPLKINCVVLKGINDHELEDLALLAQAQPLQVRFIELMPTASPKWWERHFLSMSAVRRRLRGLGPLEPVARKAMDGPARIFRVPGFVGTLGFISPLSHHHCNFCNRLRLTAQGRLRPCLMEAAEFNLKEPLREGLPDGRLAQVFYRASRAKPRGMVYSPSRCSSSMGQSMTSIGG